MTSLRIALASAVSLALLVGPSLTSTRARAQTPPAAGATGCSPHQIRRQAEGIAVMGVSPLAVRAELDVARAGGAEPVDRDLRQPPVRQVERHQVDGVGVPLRVEPAGVALNRPASE